jgi:hypothetical protein
VPEGARRALGRMAHECRLGGRAESRRPELAPGVAVVERPRTAGHSPALSRRSRTVTGRLGEHAAEGEVRGHIGRNTGRASAVAAAELAPCARRRRVSPLGWCNSGSLVW